MDERPNDDQLMATAASILFDEGNLEAVNLLLSCTLKTEWSNNHSDNEGLNFIITGPYLVVRELRKATKEPLGLEGALYTALEDAFRAALPNPYYFQAIHVGVTPFDVKENWREELLHAISGGEVHNQATGVHTKNITVWEGLRFRSTSELRIAQALDRAGVLFFPNCKARLGTFGQREVREPDFLICHEGKWGILEVDGKPYHPAERAVHDHARDRLFKNHRIVFIDHYDSDECYKKADKVVKDFLSNLAHS